jgi:hypothetical protein
MKGKSPAVIFRRQMQNPVTGETYEEQIRCKRKQAKSKVELVLKAEHIRESIQLKGYGNPLTCAMSVCAQRHQGAFPHPVHLIQWNSTTCAAVSKIKPNGDPAEAHIYTHDDDVARLFDSPDGEKELLRILEKEGDRVVSLRPAKPRYNQSNGRSRGQTNGANKRAIFTARGTALRAIKVNLGTAAPSKPKLGRKVKSA